MSEPDSIPARMAALNRTLEILNITCASIQIGPEIRQTVLELHRLAKEPVPKAEPLTIRVPESAVRTPPSATP